MWQERPPPSPGRTEEGGNSVSTCTADSDDLYPLEEQIPTLPLAPEPTTMTIVIHTQTHIMDSMRHPTQQPHITMTTQ